MRRARTLSSPASWRPVALVAALLLGSAAPVGATPTGEEPGTHARPAAVSDAWAYDLDVATPRAILVDERWYWYMPYQVTNNTGADRLFVPEVTVTNDHGEIVTAGRRIPPQVFSAVADRLANPLLASPDDVVGTLLQGQDFAKESVAIWPVSALDIDSFTVFFAGADGEVRPLISPETGEPVLVPATDPVTGEELRGPDGGALRRPVLMQRNRAFAFSTPGTAVNPGLQLVVPERRYAVMR